MSWIVSLPCTRDEAEALSGEVPELDALPEAPVIVTRDDGSKQWAYKGRPLYHWVKDAKPGDMTGDGFLNNSWHVAKP